MPVWTLTLLAALTLSFPAVAADPLSVSVFTDKASYVRGEQASFTMEVKNTSALPVTVSFSNGQQHDFAVKDASGTTLWTWSHGQTFSPNSSTRIMSPGEVLRYSTTWAFVDNAGAGVFDGILTVTGSFRGQYMGRSGAKEASQTIELITLDPLEVTFATDKSSYSKLGSPANLTLTVTNIATYAVTIDFANGQSHDFSARNASGQVWTWSNGKTFDPNPAQVVLAPGESLTLTGTWSFKNNSGASVADGNYTLSGTFLGQYYGAIPPKGGEAQVRVYTLF